MDELIIGITKSNFNIFILLHLRLCLVAVKRFPKNTYFPEMLISRKGKCFHGVWMHFKKFSGKYFLVFGKEEGKYKSRKTQATTQKKIINDNKSSPTTAPSIAIHFGVWFIQIFLQKMHQFRQKKPKPSKRK